MVVRRGDPVDADGVIVKGSMIEEYVLELQRSMSLSNDQTRHVLNFIMLQYMLRNITTGDFMIHSGKIVSIARLASIADIASHLEQVLSTGTTNIRLLPITPSEIPVIQFEPRRVGSSCTISAHELWIKYIDNLRSSGSMDG